MAFYSESGWKATRASGMLAMLLADNPDMTWADVISWTGANGIGEWVPSLDQSDDTAYVATDGAVRFDENFPSPPNWRTNWAKWNAGEEIAILPLAPVTPTQQIAAFNQIATNATAVAAVAPQQNPVSQPVATPAAPTPATPDEIELESWLVNEPEPINAPSEPAPSLIPQWIPTQVIAESVVEIPAQAKQKADVAKIGLLAGLYFLFF